MGGIGKCCCNQSCPPMKIAVSLSWAQDGFDPYDFAGGERSIIYLTEQVDASWTMRDAGSANCNQPTHTNTATSIRTYSTHYIKGWSRLYLSTSCDGVVHDISYDACGTASGASTYNASIYDGSHHCATPSECATCALDGTNLAAMNFNPGDCGGTHIETIINSATSKTVKYWRFNTVTGLYDILNAQLDYTLSDPLMPLDFEATVLAFFDNFDLNADPPMTFPVGGGSPDLQWKECIADPGCDSSIAAWLAVTQGGTHTLGGECGIAWDTGGGSCVPIDGTHCGQVMPEDYGLKQYVDSKFHLYLIKSKLKATTTSGQVSTPYAWNSDFNTYTRCGDSPTGIGYITTPDPVCGAASPQPAYQIIDVPLQGVDSAAGIRLCGCALPVGCTPTGDQTPPVTCC